MAPSFLVAIARLSALPFEGIADIAPNPGRENRLYKRGVADGNKIDVKDHSGQTCLYSVISVVENVQSIGLAVLTN